MDASLNRIAEPAGAVSDAGISPSRHPDVAPKSLTRRKLLALGWTAPVVAGVPLAGWAANLSGAESGGAVSGRVKKPKKPKKGRGR